MLYPDFIELTCEIIPIEPFRDIIISELADLGFDSFEETPVGFKSYIVSNKLDKERTLKVFERFEEDGLKVVDLKFEIIPGTNWNAVWEKNFEPVEIGDKCYVRAPFHAPSDKFAFDVIIEPKMSFGTGHHETTTLIAEWLLEESLKYKTVLDMGCGTGLLAIIAARMGAEKVLAIDNDPNAYENAVENVERNNCPQVSVLLGDSALIGDEVFDLIASNITRNVLLQDMAKYVSVLRPGGKLFMSGFFEYDKQELVLKSEKLGLELIGEKTKNGWLALCFTIKMPF